MPESFKVLNAIEKKKRGGELSAVEWTRFALDYAAGEVPDYQASALLMAAYINGLSPAETAALTEGIWKSGETLEFPGLDRPLVDKHSTGGVGDKVTPILVPILMALGLAVCKTSGRGLGHTGGTIDKLESIPGFRTTLTREEIDAQMRSIYAVIAGQTGSLAPADKKLYALRDVTGTVDSIPLIAASIMGKKLAGGAKYIALDVKIGEGAFFPGRDEAREFAAHALEAAKKHGRRAACIVSRMESPLGRNIGNALEIAEAIDALKGAGESGLMSVVVSLGSMLYAMASGDGEIAGKNFEFANKKIDSDLKTGAAYKEFEKIVTAQGGSIEKFHESMGELDNREKLTIAAPMTGGIVRIDARVIGETARALGAGRFALNDEIDNYAGIQLLKLQGEIAQKGEPFAEVYYNPAHATVRKELGASKTESAYNITKRMEGALVQGEGEYPKLDTIIEILSG